jgi:prepilin-type N-terminal cleavage/methylation domain-containing protein
MQTTSPKHTLKLKAFTLIEMLFVMLLSGIVVALTYLYFNQFRQYLNKAGNSDNASISFCQLSMVLQKDLSEAAEIYYIEPDEIRLITGESQTKYNFDQKWVVRETANATDTFQCVTSGLDVLEMGKYNYLVGTIQFENKQAPGKLFMFTYIKEYPAQILFQKFNKVEN